MRWVVIVTYGKTKNGDNIFGNNNFIDVDLNVIKTGLNKIRWQCVDSG